MRTGATLRPYQRGAQKLLSQYGDRLLCVRYRYDEQHKTRLKTVELIVEKQPWEPQISTNGPWQYKLSQLYYTPEVTAVVERLSTEQQFPQAA